MPNSPAITITTSVSNRLSAALDLVLAEIRKRSFQELLSAGFRLLNAKWVLRSCSSVGHRVSVRGRPRIDARGTIEIGNNVRIWSHISRAHISAGSQATLSIGNNTFINNGAVLSARERVEIGSRCQIAPQVTIMDFAFHGVENRDDPPPPAPIRIADNVWLGTRAVILPGVSIGENSVIAAGAVVSRSIPPNCLAGGVPAKVIRSFVPVNHFSQ